MKARSTLAVLFLITAGITPGIYAAESGQTSDGLYKNDIASSTANEATAKPAEAASGT